MDDAIARVRAARSDRSGLGLGLSITRKSIEATAVLSACATFRGPAACSRIICRGSRQCRASARGCYRARAMGEPLSRKTDPADVVPEWQRAYHAQTDPHLHGTSLAQLILGGQDGVVNVLGVLLGVSAAGGGSRIVVAAGLATAFAGALSMAAVAYTSALAQADVYRSEREREYRHVRAVPTLERAEVRDIYARQGFTGAMLERIVDTITGESRRLGRRHA